MGAAVAAEPRYAWLRLKDVSTSNNGLTITGVATTPETDRVGDEIVMEGVTFTNPVTVLLYHDGTRPVGIATLGRPTPDGVPFTATFSDPDTIQSVTLRERVLEAIESIRKRLIRGVSIGFRPLLDAIERIKETGGLRFLKTEILELSLVVVPANAGAEILSIKSFDVDRPAAPGTGHRVVSLTSPGASGTAAKAGSMQTYQEQIKSLEATRLTKQSDLEALQKTVSEAGRTKDASERESFDTLKGEIKALDAELADLREMETLIVAKAAPVLGRTPDDASRSRDGQTQHTISVRKQLPPGIEFARYVMCLACAKGFTPQAYEIAKQRYPDDARIHTILKSAVLAGTTTDAAWAGSLVDYTNFAGDFIEFLRPQTILGKFGQNGVPALRTVPFQVRIIGQTGGGDAYWVGEGAPKPLTSFAYTPTELGFAKVANIAVLSDELVRFSSPSAETLVRDSLAAAIIARIDTDFINPNKAAGTGASASPASITNGVTPIASSGATAANRDTDIRALFAAFIADNQNPMTAVWIMSATRALQLSMAKNELGQKANPNLSMNGGTFEGLPVIVSQYVAVSGSPANDIVVLANASEIYLADDGQVVIDASREASLQMLDNPTNSIGAGSPVAPVPTTVVSMFQTNSVALRAERFINWSKRRDEAVQYIENVAWTA